VLKDRIFIIAEAGVNHNGCLDTAKSLVEVAAKAGADAVKFQMFNPEELVAKSACRAAYQRSNMPARNETQLEMLRRLAMTRVEFRELAAFCSQLGIVFLSTPFDFPSVDFLDELGVPYFKISSGDLTNHSFLKYIAGKKKKLILSTGMASLGEVEEALDVLRQAGQDDTILLHCTSSYPAAFREVNLRAMLTLHRAFNLPVGYSDHTEGIEAAIAAAAIGACVIEKHFTLDRGMEGPDHKASVQPDELVAMVRAIRNVEKALGDGRKRPSESERDIMRHARRSLVAADDIFAGETITENKLTVKRPGTGIPPNMLNIIVGRFARVDIQKDSVITWDMI